MYYEGADGGRGRKCKGAKSPIGVILLSSSFYVKQVLVMNPPGPVAIDGKGGATVPWHSFDAGCGVACLGSNSGQ